VDGFTLRRATPADVPAAMAIIGAALADYGLPFEPQGRDADVAAFGRRADNDDFIAELGGPGTAVGLASVGPHGDWGVAWLSKVFVARGARGQGIGRALVVAAEDAARSRGYTRMGLRTRTVFREAIALYESLGYAATHDRTAILESGDRVYFRPL
jgi:GNAT superfamily N-acetyltransferase